MTPLETVLDRLGRDNVKRQQRGWQARCPAHEDENPSLSISEGSDGTVLVRCHAGCDAGAVVKAAGLELGDLFPPKPDGKPELVAEYDYHDEAGALLFQVVRFEPKSFRQRRPGDPGEDKWVWNLNGVRRALYRLPDLLLERDHVLLVEGEKDVDALVAKGLTATTCPGGAGKWRNEYNRSLRHVTTITIVADRDEPGRNHAHQVADSLRSDGALDVTVVQPPEGCKDISDMLAKGLTRHDLEPIDGDHGHPDVLDVVLPQDPQPDPWEGTLGDLLDEVVALFRRFIAFPEDPHQSVTVTLWAAHTPLAHRLRTTPYLHISSAEPESGKSQTLDVLELVVWRPWMVITPSPAVVFRKLDLANQDHGLTLLLDEVDAVFGKGSDDSAEALRAVLNAGHTKGRPVPRCVGPSQQLVDFHVYGAKALAGIKSVPDTIATRAIRIAMKRRRPRDKVDPLFPDEVAGEAQVLRAGLEQFAADIELSRLRDVRRELLDLGLGDRAADGWSALVAIADHAGGEWPQAARDAAVALSARDDHHGQSLGLRLLADTRDVLAGWPHKHVFSTDLREKLIGIEDAPWSDYKGGEVTQRTIAFLLADYDVPSGTRRIDGKTQKGYRMSDLEDAWIRYLGSDSPDPPDSSVTSVTTAQPQGFQPISEASHLPDVTDVENPETPRGARVVTDVTDKTSGDGGIGVPVNCEVCDRDGDLSFSHGVWIHRRCAPADWLEPEEIAGIAGRPS